MTVDNPESAWHIYAALRQYEAKHEHLKTDILYQETIGQAYSYYSELFQLDNKK